MALPLPPPEFARLPLQVEELRPMQLVRLAWAARRTHCVFRRDARYRFDAPDGEFGVLYAACDLRTAFVESVLRERPQTLAVAARVVLSWREVATRRVITFRSGSRSRPLRLIALRGAGLSAARIDNRISTVDDYATTRQWALACHRHPARADGILYLSRFLGESPSVAIFDRARPALAVRAVQPLVRLPEFAALLDEFDVGLERPPRGRRGPRPAHAG